MGTRTDWRKHRKHTHLASVDLDIMKTEGHNLIFNIKEIKWEKNVNVSGQKMDGFFCYFKEPVKAMKINNTNLMVLAEMLKNDGVSVEDIYVVEEYRDMVIELYVDRQVKHMGAIKEGIRIRKQPPVMLTDKDLKKLKLDLIALANMKQLTDLFNSNKGYKTSKEATKMFTERAAELKKQ